MNPMTQTSIPKAPRQFIKTCYNELFQSK